MKSRFTEEQIVKALQRLKSGLKQNDLARELASRHRRFGLPRLHYLLTVKACAIQRSLGARL